MAVPVDGLIDWLKQQLGKPYVWAAEGPNSYDCSGLVQAAFKRYGVNLPRVSVDQATTGQAVSQSDIRPGDLVFSNWGRGRNTHVGIAVSSNQIINAPKPGSSVKYQTLTAGYRRHITAVRRLPQVTQGSTTVTQPNSVGSALGNTAAGLAGSLGNGLGAPSNGSLAGGGEQPTAGAATGGTATSGGGLLDKIAAAIETGLAPLVAVKDVGDKLINAFMPTMIIRVVCGILGVICIMAGLFFVFRNEG